MGDELERVSMDEIEAEGATALPNKEVMSLLDVNANVDLGLNLAAPVDLAAAANLNVAAPIEAAASANLLSDDAQATAISQQHGTIDQGITGSAEATAPQTAEISQDANPEVGTGTAALDGDAGTAAPPDGTTDGVGDTVGGLTDGVGDAVGGTTGAVGDTVGGVTDGVGDTVGGVTDGVGDTVGGVTDGVGDTVGGVTDGVGDTVGGVTD